MRGLLGAVVVQPPLRWRAIAALTAGLKSGKSAANVGVIVFSVCFSVLTECLQAEITLSAE